ncbi:MAG: hypothetical protein GX114_05900, partial [Clostridiales bacterium]|nr:hypothetical protein [Clostridiales bacterium]
MKLSPVIAELITERIKDSLTLRLGETFAARVLEVRDRMLLLKLEGGTVIQTRLIADLDFKRGQDIVLQVKGIGEGRIVLAVAGPEGDRISQIESFNVEAGTRAALEDTGIIVKMVENGLPVTPNNTETIQRAIKHICYLLDKAVLSAEHLPPVDIDLVNAPLGELVKWLIGAGEGTPINRPAADGNQKLSLLMAELPGVEAEDVIKLTKHGMRISLANIVLAKNLRENKGFPDILLKLLFKQAGLKEERADEGASKARHPLSRTGGDEHPVERGANEANKRMEGKRPTVEPVDIKLLLESIKTAGKARPYQRAAAELLAQRTVLLEEALAGQTFSIFTFLFRQEPCGCIIRSDRNRGG